MKIKFLALLLIKSIAATQWNFNVVSLNDKTFKIGLKYNNAIISLNSEVFPLFKGSIESTSNTNYKYVLLDSLNNVVQEEPFERNFDTNNDTTLNEVFNRKNLIYDIKSVPNVYDSLFQGGSKKMEDFPGNEIFTVYATCDDATYTNMKLNPIMGETKNESSSKCVVTLITSNSVITQNGDLSLVGFNSRFYKKLSWKFKMEKRVLGRKSLKLRSMAADPSLIRDKMTNTLMRSMGLAIQSQNYARLIINDEVWGLYSLVDPPNTKWLASAIHGDDDHRVGYSYKMFSSVPDGPFASLRYLGEDLKAYEKSGAYAVDEIDSLDTEAPHNFTRLAEFTRKFQEWIDFNQTNLGKDEAAEKSITELNNFFYIDSILRQMVIESLVFAYDNFWAQLGNYNLYRHPDTSKYLIIPYDFDGSFLGSMGSQYYPDQAIEDCIGWANNTPVDKYLANSILSHEIIANRYGEIMRDAIDKVFNNEVLSPYVDSLVTMLSDDVEWNFAAIDGLDAQIPGNVNHWTYQNFIDNTNYEPILYYSDINTNDAHHAIKEWIDLRGGYCKAYVNSLDLSHSYSKLFVSSASSSHTPKQLRILLETLVIGLILNLFF